jgi:hypothetical protein
MPRRIRTADEALARRVDTTTTPDGCHHAIGKHDASGYAYIWAEGKLWLAHRLAWTVRHGPIPDGLRVCHTCDTPDCCRDDHHFLGTAKENTHDMMAKGRGALGSRVGTSRLTEDQVREIRRLHAAGHTGKEIAATFGVSHMAISRAIRGVYWGHVA